MPRYRYTPLPEGERIEPFTRLLTLFPGEYSSPISCALEIVNVTQCQSVPYEALSYVWGRETAPAPIFCGDGELRITANLDHALRHLRLARPRKLWVDALCIDQENMDERARQVGYMRLVYKHAALVIVWLGPKVPGVERAFDSVRRLAELQDDLLHSATTPGQPSQTFLGINAFPEATTIMIDQIRGDPELADDMVRLFGREYFERVWCIQEVVVSTAAIARCEDLEVDFFRLISLAKYVEEYQGYRFPLGTLQYWSTVFESRRRQRMPQGSVGKLQTILMGVRDFKSTDPRDRIFAFLGISDEGLDPVRFFSDIPGGEQSTMLRVAQGTMRWISNKLNAIDPGYSIGNHPAIVPNYKKPFRDVYRDFVRFAVRKPPRALDILSQVQHATDPSSETDWPSWVAKFHEPRSAGFLPAGFYTAGIPLMGHLAYFAELHDCPLRGNPREPDLLQLRGFKIGQVEAVSDVLRFDVTDPLPVQRIWNQLFDLPLFPRPNRKYVLGDEELDTAFFMTLCLGPAGSFQSMLPRFQLGPTNLDRVTSFQLMSRRAKINILLWLQQETPVDARSYTDLVRVVEQSPDLAGEISPDLSLQGPWYRRSVWSVCQNRRVYRTTSGLLGLGPQMMQPGDTVVVLFGGSYPFILRPSGPEWIFIGD